jgi:carbamoyl-phosphate synthase large subunit
MQATVLVSSAGRRVGLIDCFRRSAAAEGLNLTVLACDVEPDLSAACRAADQAFAVPRCDDPAFVDALLEIAKAWGVDLIVPTIDPELGPLAAAAKDFGAIGTRVHVSPPHVIDVVRDKVRTAEVLCAAGVPVPRTSRLEQVIADPVAASWPVFLKPCAGSASRGVKLARTPDDLAQAFDEPMMVQEFLIGSEYTVNMFVDAQGSLRNAIAHQRLRVRAGEVEKGRTERNPLFRELAELITTALPDARGVLCFQLIMCERRGPCVFEINARFGGGYPLAHFAGAEYTRWLLQEVLGLPSTAHDHWRSGALMLRYDAATFVG